MLVVHIDRKIKDFKPDSQGVLMLNKFKENKRTKRTMAIINYSFYY